MKKFRNIFYACLCSVLITPSLFGQLTIVDSIPVVNLRSQMENVFSQIDKSSISTGILMEKGLLNLDPSHFDGSVQMNNTSSFHHFRIAYEQLFYARIDTLDSLLLPVDSLSKLYRWHNGEKATAIAEKIIKVVDTERN